MWVELLTSHFWKWTFWKNNFLKKKKGGGDGTDPLKRILKLDKSNYFIAEIQVQDHGFANDITTIHQEKCLTLPQGTHFYIPHSQLGPLAQFLQFILTQLGIPQASLHSLPNKPTPVFAQKELLRKLKVGHNYAKLWLIDFSCMDKLFTWHTRHFPTHYARRLDNIPSNIISSLRPVS